ncbi:hypothetical protein EXIGLDRAFT_610365 [Exidia glandulosa HHB12029]|uniref:Poly A polymerase head domain-containing protein n=1 Tax=Exidia glandulosa HHB12029 TaxID=1314781 RepID=A0A166AVP7_EXIGL|nr:hypothetical protein EXIGLDRAFT_610365 [Exidia glandulosa HHB12029]
MVRALHSPRERVQVPGDGLHVRLNEVEERICALLDECCKTVPEARDVECRIAGGWVRDKLLGMDSDDIDIALSKMMGYPFTLHFQRFLASKGVAVTSVHKVEKNAEKSKHLEPGSLTVFGQKIEFVNLRSEEYAEDSRIPTIEFGTPLEDALRRDATINSLFYNVHKRAVEDQTEKGIPDLKAGIIRTPLPARDTFLDDPLRVLRCIRFSSKFGFELDSDVRAAAADPEIQQAIMAKVSRERVGIEVEKMLNGRDPPTAIELIHDLSLYHTVFAVPPTVALSQPPGDSQTAVIATILVQNILSSSSDTSPLSSIHRTLLEHALNDKEVKARLYMGAAVTPFSGGTYVAKKKKHFAAEAAIWEGLRLGTQGHYLDGVPLLFEAASVLENPQLSRLGVHPSGSERVALGLLLRQKCIHNPTTGTSWQASVLFSLIQELVRCYDVQKNELDASKASPIIELYNTLVTRIEALDLPSTLAAKPLLDGNTVTRLLGQPKGGPWLQGVLHRVLEWQLDHPAASSEECETWLAAEHAAGRIELTSGSKRRGEGPARDGKRQRTD